ncbi:PQQ-dependent sugar dehydrogenase [Sinomicrobium weinanense]|uniref:PQQ-dependent sugar dehydrogenase n=1 Tax=Sinomicrobium weinanense TaxID=2842200 RepID=A0A926JV81_9FLAO|nr:PQQ-dependent sugar dehydrogenase [Sinomicrobium weinanense]MBC9797986.1 PQQ-dependent sugar dehydrogenase [Sinomicrobium weinanense]MBU3125497.1 PQQ-dependent sugar dehydrogenase [Sinomicrobium weinanense]
MNRLLNHNNGLNIAFVFKKRLLTYGVLFAITVSLFAGCTSKNDGLPPGDPDNAGLFLPGDFEAVAVVDSLKGRARHLTVNTNGDIYVKLRFPDDEGGNAALRDIDNDGKADIIKTFDDYIDRSSYGTEMRINKGYLYFSSVTRIYRQKLTDELVPDTELELILTDTQPPRQHDTKPIAFDKEGNLYTVFGAPSDACQVDDRSPLSPGMFPCPLLETRGGVWRFDADKKNQFQEDGQKFATGLRSVVGMDWNEQDNNLYAVVHGRDYLHSTWPNEFTAWEGAVLPSEVFVRLKEGDDAGWPYHYYDQIKDGYFLSPEYGGDGEKQGEDIDKLTDPVVAFPGHFAPNDILFYKGDQFPERYKNGAFIAFHGSTSSNPYPQSGYFVGFVPMENGVPTGPWEVFADGFAEQEIILNTSDATYRPMGLAEGPDGSLYVSDSKKGKIWRIMYKGDKDKFGEAQLAGMEKRKRTAPNIKTPVENEDMIVSEDDDLDKYKDENLGEGGKLYNIYCAICHQRNGLGNDRFPPLNNTEWVLGDRTRLINVVLKGLRGEIFVNEKSYTNVMPKLDRLTDEEIAGILTYIRQSFGNSASGITPEEVAGVRKANAAE